MIMFYEVVDALRRGKKCDRCGSKLEPVTMDGWVDIFRVRNRDGLRIKFFGVFREFEGLRGIFGWIEHPEQIPEGQFCRRGHIGISKEGRVVHE